MSQVRGASDSGAEPLAKRAASDEDVMGEGTAAEEVATEDVMDEGAAAEEVAKSDPAAASKALVAELTDPGAPGELPTPAQCLAMFSVDHTALKETATRASMAAILASKLREVDCAARETLKEMRELPVVDDTTSPAVAVWTTDHHLRLVPLCVHLTAFCDLLLCFDLPLREINEPFGAARRLLTQVGQWAQLNPQEQYLCLQAFYHLMAWWAESRERLTDIPDANRQAFENIGDSTSISLMEPAGGADRDKLRNLSNRGGLMFATTSPMPVRVVPHVLHANGSEQPEQAIDGDVPPTPPGAKDAPPAEPASSLMLVVALIEQWDPERAGDNESSTKPEGTARELWRSLVDDGRQRAAVVVAHDGWGWDSQCKPMVVAVPNDDGGLFYLSMTDFVANMRRVAFFERIGVDMAAIRALADAPDLPWVKQRELLHELDCAMHAFVKHGRRTRPFENADSLEHFLRCDDDDTHLLAPRDAFFKLTNVYTNTEIDSCFTVLVPSPIELRFHRAVVPSITCHQEGPARVVAVLSGMFV
jgi:hypothetical protein